MRSETSRFSRETFRFSWNLLYFADPFVSRETSRLSQNPSIFSWLMAGHLTRKETSQFSRETFRFSWNFSSFAETFRFSRSFSFSQKPFGFLPWLMAGHPLPINSLGILQMLLTFFLKRKRKREAEKFKWGAERKEKKSSFQISNPNPVTSSVEIRTEIKALRLVRPHAPQVVR